MKTFFAILFAVALLVSALPVQAQTETKQDESVSEKASDAADTGAEKAKEAADTTAEKTKKAARTASKKTKEGADTAAKKTKEAVSEATGQTKITREQAQQAVMKKYLGAKIISCNLDTVKGNSVWHVKFTRTGANLAETVTVDAQTGAVTRR